MDDIGRAPTHQDIGENKNIAIIVSIKMYMGTIMSIGTVVIILVTAVITITSSGTIKGMFYCFLLLTPIELMI